jgi:hypothetical protein
VEKQINQCSKDKKTNNINGTDGNTIAPYFTNMAAMAFNNPAPLIYLWLHGSAISAEPHAYLNQEVQDTTDA